ncbi:cytochrome P450 monooxygenase-like protein [Clohesyomyces aquaticus]|uniref:Cytochrome P450 monooxygenase-like protein n=1 Tax=Clohesyomyces aquaticus TaxID=1231657 RepID=A0A1Y1YRF3_9PLEO|nr:cytochrome P450 monooxygenase-like protein [Clohesyomyces aquaticus]
MAVSTTLFPDDFRLFSPTGIAFSVGAFTVLVALYTLGTAIYNVYFHPLSHIPGPLLSRASPIPYVLHTRSGNIVKWIRLLHEQYGDVVRVTPTDVSFISGETAWQDIYGFHTGKQAKGAYLKDRTWFARPMNNTWSMIQSDEATHSRMRRNLSHAFSDKALRDQEGIIQGFVNLLVSRLHDEANANKVVDIMSWYNYTTFDVIADLTFGEPLYCLRDRGYHPWVNMVFGALKAIGFIATRAKYPIVNYYDIIKTKLGPPQADLTQKRKEFFKLSADKVTQRLEKETDRPDFMHHVLKNQAVPEKAMTREEIDSNANLMLIAGSETTATMLSGTTFLLLKNPKVYAKLVHEIRSKFSSQDQITIDEVSKMEYLIACLQEGLRYYPPVPTGFPRIVPKGGDRISGHYIPEGMAVYMSQHAANHSSRNYKDPDAYVPERWLGAAEYESDNRAATQPFSFGSRNCLGKNSHDLMITAVCFSLAYAEMRLIMAKVLWNFDLELVDSKVDWFNQKVFTLWDKAPLKITLKPVQR